MDAKHRFVAGPSGGGKSTLLREMWDKNDGISVWIVLSDTDVPQGAIDCEGLRDLMNAVRSCDNKRELRNLRLAYYPSNSGPMAAKVPVEFAKRVSNHFNTEICTGIYADECEQLIPDDEEKSSRDNNPTAWAMHEGRDLNIKVVVATQDPMEVYYSPIKNTEYFVWCGPIKTWHAAWVNAWDLRGIEFPQENHRYAVIDHDEPASVVGTGTTKKQYA